MTTLESITFYKRELSSREFQEARRISLRKTTHLEIKRQGTSYKNLLENNLNYFLSLSYRAKLYRENGV